jgi:hypothetical protein
MNHEAIENIKAELDHLDPAALQSIREIIHKSKRRSSPVPETRQSSDMPPIDIEEPLPFIGDNLAPEEYEKLTLQKRGELQWRLRQQNRSWLEETFAKLNAAWLVVIDGKVTASGKTLKNKPRQKQILEICRRTGKFPFVFVNDKLIVIEESASSWHATKQLGDYYPTLPITLGPVSSAVDVVGDFDTGANHTFVDHDFLIAHNIIQPEAGDYTETHLHLNQKFVYVDKLIRIQLLSISEEVKTLETWICCVPNWHHSPFVALNPNRIALIGRDLLLELKPNVRLDFDKRQTEILPVETPRQSRKKTSGGQKRTKPRSSRRR